MKKQIILLFFIFIFSISLFSQENYTDNNKDISFIMSENWQCMKYDKLKYKLVVGERVANFTQNIVINSEEFEGSMEEYIAYSIENLKIYLPDIKIKKNELFENDSNIPAWKLICENDYQVEKLRQYYYFFKNDNTFFVCVASVLQSSSEEIEVLFDESMKTFSFMKKEEKSDK